MTKRTRSVLTRLVIVAALGALCASPGTALGLDFRTYEFAADPADYTGIDGPAIQSARVESYDDGRVSFTIRLNRALVAGDTLRLSIDPDNRRETGETFIRYGRDLDIVLQSTAWGLQRFGETSFFQVPIGSLTLSSANLYIELDAARLGIAPGTSFGVSFETLWQLAGQSGSYQSLLPDYVEDPWWAFIVPTMALAPPTPVAPAPPAPAPAPRRHAVVIRADAAQVQRGSRVFVRLTGTTRASERGRQLLVEHRIGTRHVPLCRARIARNGSFTALCRVDPLFRGTATTLRLRARLPQTRVAKAASRSLLVRVSRPG